MAKFAFVKFKINNDFFEWEKHFYASQPMARKAGMLELFHGMQSDDPSSCAVLVSIESQEKMDEFMNKMYIENIWYFSKDKNKDIFKHCRVSTLESFF